MDLPCAARCWARCTTMLRLAAYGKPDAPSRIFHRQVINPQGLWTGRVLINTRHLLDPLRIPGSEVIAAGYHGDLALLSDEDKAKIFAIMGVCYRHTFLVLTKRPALLLDWMPTDLSAAADKLEPWAERFMGEYGTLVNWPLPNVWIGASISNQAEADERIPLLLRIPAERRWVSIEPMLGPVSLIRIPIPRTKPVITMNCLRRPSFFAPRIHMVVVGGESGALARPMHPEWLRSVRDDCAAAGVPFNFKQWGEWLPQYQERNPEARLPNTCVKHVWDESNYSHRVGKKAAGRVLDGRTYDAVPGGGR
jgi:protein gp37